jgi:ribosome-binding protein aMBF1 (putative translation factor)
MTTTTKTTTPTETNTTPTVKVKTNGINGNTVPAYSDTDDRTKYLAEYGDTSKAIRGLLAKGWKQSAVAKALNIRPQHVNNVSRQVLKAKA